jgi:hypothetical protein
VDDLMKEVRNTKIGQSVQVTYWRGNAKNTTSLVLGKTPPPATP